MEVEVNVAIIHVLSPATLQ